MAEGNTDIINDHNEAIADTDEKDMAERTEIVVSQFDDADIRTMIHFIRGQQVMLDSDLALLYQVETKNLNRSASRNSERFPEDFRFKLDKSEYEGLMFQFGTSNNEESRGGRRYLPYVYTEQGIAMLAGILRSQVAVDVSISIMRAFVEMRRFIATNETMFERISSMELKQLEYQRETDERFNRVFGYIESHLDSSQKIFFDGQIYDAFSFFVELISKATREIILIDAYLGVDTLNILAKKKHGVSVVLYTRLAAKASLLPTLATSTRNTPGLRFVARRRSMTDS